MADNGDVMINLNQAMNLSGIKMEEKFIHPCLRENMEERFICIRMNHFNDFHTAAMYRDKEDIKALVKESDRRLSKSRGEEVQTCIDDIDGLLFWGDKIMVIDEEGERDVATWCRLFTPSGSICCVCQESAKSSIICTNCQAVCCHPCNRKIESTQCPVCREPEQFNLGK